MILYMGFSALHSIFSFPVVLNIYFQFLTRKIAIFDKIDCYFFAHTEIQLFSEAKVSPVADIHTFKINKIVIRIYFIPILQSFFKISHFNDIKKEKEKENK